MKINKKWFCNVVFCVAILLYLGFALWRCSFIQINSDFANLVLQGNDIISGNLFRKDWNLTGISFLTTDVLYYCLGAFLFGVSNRAYIFASALMQLALVLASLLLIKDEIKKDFAMKAGIFVVFAMIPCLSAINLLRAHTGVFIICFIAIFLYSRIKENRFQSRKKSLLYVVLLALGAMGDPIILIILPMPIAVWSLILWLQKKMSGKDFVFDLGLNASGALLGLILDKLYFSAGGANKNSFLESKIFVSWDDIGEKFVIYIRSLFTLSDAMFENQILSQVSTIFYAVNAFAVVLFFVVILTNIARAIQGKSFDFITVILGIGFLIMSALFIITTISVDISSARYYSYFPAMMAIAFVRNSSLLPHENIRIKAFICILITVISLGKVISLKTDQKGVDYEHIELAQILIENQLTNGYSSFWNASSTTVLSNERVTVRAIIGLSGRLEMYNWFCKNSWYSEPANFVITAKDDIYGITEEQITSILGMPSKRIEYKNFQILVYDFDVTQFLYNGLSDGVITGREWYRNENTLLQEQSCYVLQNGMLWGPYITLESGQYNAVLYGVNLDLAEYDIYSNAYGGFIQERKHIDFASEYKFTLEMPDTISDFEIRIYNENEETVIVDKLILDRVTYD